ncbi:coiled-coil domain-containing protein 57-like [Hylobates moloch]|uniref:coiled-coil domain-containing protein 57-like n=1 Tax=Hylobates moloch TaxID=81572 RepID=UPI0026756867|nr:coiled-coil domain-containing protein 57-like [Hylobates moloch]
MEFAMLATLVSNSCPQMVHAPRPPKVLRLQGHEELDRLAREKDAVLVAVKGAHVEQLQELQARVLELQAHCETLEAQLRRAEWRQADTAKEKDAAIDQ